jgi:putative ABC transport system permease protein
MGAVWMRVRAELSHRLRASIGLVLVIGLAGGLVIASAAGARRTSSTYEKFRAAQNTAQTGIANSPDEFGFASVDFDKAEQLPQVIESARFSFFIAFIKTSRGKFLTPIGDRNPTVLFASMDGKFDRKLNRMFIIEGRLSNPGAQDEVVASYIAAQSYDLHVGDTLDSQFPSLTDFSSGRNSTTITGPRVRFTIVGIEATSAELPPGLGYPPLHLTPAFYQRYKDQTPTFAALNMKLKHDSDFSIVADELQSTIVHKPGGTFSNRIQLFDEVSNAHAIGRTVHIQAIALWLLAALAGLASMLILAQALVRESFNETQEYPALRALGMTSRELFTSAFVRMLVIGFSSAFLAVVVAVAVSPAMPIGVPRLVDLHPGLSFDVVALALGAFALVALVGGFGAFASARAAREASGFEQESEPQNRSRIAGAMAGRSFPPTAVAGVRMALERGRGRTAVPVRSTLFGTIVAIAALITAFGFGASIDHLLATPRLVGWNWSGTVGDDFDAEDAARVIPILRADPDIAEFSAGGAGNIQIGNTSIPVLAQDPIKGFVGPLLFQGGGRAPRAANEIALGSRTLRLIGRDVGDTVSVQVGNARHDLRIVGRAVIAPLVNDTATGVGAWMTFQGLRRFGPGLSEDIYVFRFADGVDPKAGVAGLRKAIPDLAIDLNGGEGETGNLRRVSNLPVVLAGLLALIAAATLTHTITSIVRRRDRDFAILKTLGFARSQVRATVAWQATTLVVITLIVGVPLGIATGRWLWTVFANQLGVVPAPVVRPTQILLAIPAALLLANVIALIAGRAAARARPALVLRSE